MNHHLSTIIVLILLERIIAMPVIRQGTFNEILRLLAILVALALFVLDPA